MLEHLQEQHQDEKGFTLIELMVVVLIMGILMAIAIPTFLSTRSSANDASAKSNATNAYTNEKSYYAANQIFLAANGSTDAGNNLDGTLPWGTTSGGVQAAVLGTTAPTSTVVVAALSVSGNCFYIEDSESASAGVIGYAETTGNTVCYATPIAALATVTAGAGTAVLRSTTAIPTTFYSSWP